MSRENFCVIRDKSGHYYPEYATPRWLAETDVMVRTDLTQTQATQTAYAFNRGIEKAFSGAVDRGSGLRFDYADKVFAWFPVKLLVTGEWVWFQHVMRMHFVGHFGDYAPNIKRNMHAPLGNQLTG